MSFCSNFFTAKNKEGGKHVKLGKRKCTAEQEKFKSGFKTVDKNLTWLLTTLRI